MKTGPTKAALKVFQTLDALLPHFVHGLTPSDLAKATGFPATAITHYVVTLIEAGFAERIEETGRIRPAMRLARAAVTILSEVDKTQRRLDEVKARISTPFAG
jgi:DNA-binding IclR family transcriptional regulator